MIYSLTAWDQIGSSIVGAAVAGVFGGLTVLLGVHFGRKDEEKRYHRAEQDRAAAERRRAADVLMIAVSDLRDELALSRRGVSGDVRLYPLREKLLIAESSLGGLPSLAAVHEFYGAAVEYRSWIRDHSMLLSDDEPTRRALQQFRERYARYGDRVIEMLQKHHDDPDVRIDGRAVLPTLPV